MLDCECKKNPKTKTNINSNTLPWQKAGLKGNEIDRTSTEYAKIIGKGKKNAVKLNCLYTLYIRTSRISNRSRLLETAVSLSIFYEVVIVCSVTERNGLSLATEQRPYRKPFMFISFSHW